MGKRAFGGGGGVKGKQRSANPRCHGAIPPLAPVARKFVKVRALKSLIFKKGSSCCLKNQRWEKDCSRKLIFEKKVFAFRREARNFVGMVI